MLGCNNDRLFPEKYTGKDHICNTKRVQRILLMPHGASRNTPLIELIQYGRRIGKKVYCALLEYLKVYPIRSHPQLLSCLLAALKVRIFFLYHYSYVILQRGIERYYRDLTEIQCAIRADDKFFDGMWNFVNLKTVKWLILVYLWISCHG